MSSCKNAFREPENPDLRTVPGGLQRQARRPVHNLGAHLRDGCEFWYSERKRAARGLLLQQKKQGEPAIIDVPVRPVRDWRIQAPWAERPLLRPGSPLAKGLSDRCRGWRVGQWCLPSTRRT